MAKKTARKQRNRSQLTRAELQAYEARRADERKRVGATHEGDAAAVAVAPRQQFEHSFEMNRDDEFTVIRSDLIRLLIVMAIITVLLVVATVVLR